MRTFRIAYDGRPYRGFQRQPNVPTVEDALFDALRDLDALGGGDGGSGDDGAVETPPGYAAAGRTDAGVSALAQTVAFEAPEWLTPAALNGELPASIRAWAIADAPADFHATHDALAREYAYHLYAPAENSSAGGVAATQLAEERSVDDEQVRAALDRLAGEHDFRDLTPDSSGTVRDLSTAVARDGAFLVLRFRAGGFARHLVRRLVALVAAVGRGEVPIDRVDRHLDDDPLAGHEATGTAPAEPLVLTDVEYDLAFAVDEAGAASARDVFAERRVEHATNTRVAGLVRDGIGDTG